MSASKEGHVYLIHAENTTFYKIGKTSGSVEGRLKSLQTGSPHRLYVVEICITRDYEAIETMLHQAFIDYRHSGEWFDLDEDLVELVQDILVIPEVLIRAQKGKSLYDISTRSLKNIVSSVCWERFAQGYQPDIGTMFDWDRAFRSGEPWIGMEEGQTDTLQETGYCYSCGASFCYESGHKFRCACADCQARRHLALCKKRAA